MTKLEQSYSQAKQDVWVRSLFPDLNNGTFVDIGCNHPTKLSNTYALELLGWRGLLVDVEADCVAQCRAERKSRVVQADGRALDWLPAAIAAGIVVVGQFDRPITYLSLDCDEVTPPVLTRILGSGLRFKCMTVEHDRYRFGDGPRNAMREQLLQAGYKLAVADVANGPGYEFEDWLVE